MRVLRYFLVSGAAVVVAGSLTFATQATVTTGAAPDHAAIQPSAHFLAQARAALVSYLSTNQQAPPFTSGNQGGEDGQPARLCDRGHGGGQLVQLVGLCRRLQDRQHVHQRQRAVEDTKGAVHQGGPAHLGMGRY
jgi:hypothetical protein